MNRNQLEECNKCNDCSECQYSYTLSGKYYKCGADKTKEQIKLEQKKYNNIIH